MADPTQVPIAIIGIGCRLPGGVTNTDELWDLLLKGRNVWTPVPPGRFTEDSFYHPNPNHDGTTNHRGGHFLAQDVAAFDASFFGISPLEAQAMDPQQRLLLEVTYEAFENAGIPAEDVRGSRTAVYVATFTHDYDRLAYKDPYDLPKYQVTGTGDAIASNRISYVFDLRGPSVTLDTGCSGSVVALDQACKSLRLREADMALASGVNLILSPDHMVGMSNLKFMLNEDGKSYPFDSRGSGYGRGEGIATVVLKRLDDALRAGDNVRAIIKRTAVNQDGKTNGITLPSQAAQQQLATSIYKAVDIDPSTVSYVEAHGTGTLAGDSAELNGIANVFCTADRVKHLYVGSIKSNIGHLESTSGLAGLIKSVLILEHEQIPPEADFQEGKPILHFDDWNMRIPTKLEPWPLNMPLRVSLNSFGYGGTNAHAILESGPQMSSRSSQLLGTKSIPSSPQDFLCEKRVNGVNSQVPTDEGPRLFILSANSSLSVAKYAEKFGAWTGKQKMSNGLLADVSSTLLTRRSILKYRHSFVADSQTELMSSLNTVPSRVDQASEQHRIVFVFTGQGAQWHAMGRDMIGTNTSFAQSLSESDAILRSLGATWSLLTELTRLKEESRINESEIAQPTSTALQIALVDHLVDIGLGPQVVLGHSSGEIAAAYSAGVLSHESALKVSYHRSFLSAACRRLTPQKGAMLAVGTGESKILLLLTGKLSARVSVACVNSPTSTTLSGDELAIIDVQKELDRQGIFNKRLQVDTAYHSHHMQMVASEYLHSLAGLQSGASKLRTTFVSTVTGQEKNTSFGAEYWVENLVSKVSFFQALQTIHEKSSEKPETKTLFVEFGPHSALRGPIRQTMTQLSKAFEYSYLNTIEKGESASRTILQLCGQLVERGVKLDLKTASMLPHTRNFSLATGLPTYSWDHSSTYWHQSRVSKAHLYRRHPQHDLLGIRSPEDTPLEPTWRYFVDTKNLPWLAEHVIDNLCIFPGASYLCMAIEAAQQLALDEIPSQVIKNFILRNVRFTKALVVPDFPAKVEMRMRFRDRSTSKYKCQEFSISSVLPDEVWHEHCKGCIIREPFTDSAIVDGSDISKFDSGRLPTKESLLSSKRVSCCQTVDPKDLYGQLQQQGNYYGPCFASIESFAMGHGEGISSIKIPDIASIMPEKYQQPHLIHPATLDALMHSALPVYHNSFEKGSVMPAYIHEFKVSAIISSSPGINLQAATSLIATGAKSAKADVYVFEESAESFSEPAIIIEGIEIRQVGSATPQTSKTSKARDMSYQVVWAPDVSQLSSRSEFTSVGKGEDSYQAHIQFKDPSLVIEGRHRDDSTWNGQINNPIKHKTEETLGRVWTISENPSAVADCLRLNLNNLGYEAEASNWGSTSIRPQDIQIILDEGRVPIFAELRPDRFEQIKALLIASTKVFWISIHEDKSTLAILGGGLVSGFARSARGEYTGLNFVTLDVQDCVDTSVERLCQTIADLVVRSFGPDPDSEGMMEFEYAYRNGQVIIPRLIPNSKINAEVRKTVGEPVLTTIIYGSYERPLKLAMTIPDSIESLSFVDDEAMQTPLQPTQLEIAVKACALNPIDTTSSLGQAPGSTPILREVSGLVTTIGQNIIGSGFCQGDRVCAWTYGGQPYASSVRVDRCQVALLADAVSFSAGAMMPVPLMTAYHTWIDLAGLREGQTVFICGAAGPLGEAALVVAQRVGVTILAAVSTTTERDFLCSKYGLASKQIFSIQDYQLSRSVLCATGNNGADVILSLPTQDAVTDLCDCLAVMGAFIRVIDPLHAAEDRYFTSSSSKMASNVVFDLPTLMEYQLETAMPLLGKATALVGPLNFEFSRTGPSIKMSEVTDAFKMVRSRKLLGKLALEAEDDSEVPFTNLSGAPARADQYHLNPNATYMIAGGAGDLGLKMSFLMAERGAKFMIILSRKGLGKTRLRSMQQDLEKISDGLKLFSIECDISEPSDVRQILPTFQEIGLPPVAGIVQSASVLKDGVLERMSIDDFQLPLKTKLHGTRHLWDCFQGSHLDFFISFASLSGVSGTRAQANYAAGNTGQDALAQKLSNSNTHVMSLDLGMIADANVYRDKEGQARSKALTRQGMIPVPGESLMALFDYAISPQARLDQCHQAVMGIDGKSVFEASNSTPTMQSALFSHVRAAYKSENAVTKSGDNRSIREIILEAKDMSEVHQIMSTAIGRRLSDLLALGPHTLASNEALGDFGLDSLTSIEIKGWISQEFESTVQASEILDESSILALGRRVASRSSIVKRNPNLHQQPGDGIEGTTSEDAQREPSRAMTNEGLENENMKRTLPKLPLPDLEESLDLYLESAQPFIPDEAYERTARGAQKLRRGKGQALQRKLQERAADPTIENWQHDLQVSGVYLRRRDPVHPGGTFYGSHLLSTNPHSQAERAAVISAAAYQFMKRIDDDELKQDLLNGEPMCMDSLNWLFNTNRRPCVGVDKVERHPQNEYCIALRRGHVCKIELQNSDGAELSYYALLQCFEEVLGKSEEAVLPIVALSSGNRDEWAQLRDSLISAEPNYNTVMSIERAAFVVCLDDGSPCSSTERCNQFLLGNPANRWADKALQFVVCENGMSGYVCEHSKLDGASLKQSNEYITNAILAHKPSRTHPTMNGLLKTLYTELPLTTDAAMTENILRVQQNFTATTPPASFVEWTTQEIGHNFLRSHKLPAKSGMQLVIQLAALLHYGTQHPSWEILTMMPFQLGRLDWMQVVSRPILAFCAHIASLPPSDLSSPESLRLLREATTAHTSTMTRIARGRGFAAHLEALRELWCQEESSEGVEQREGVEMQEDGTDRESDEVAEFFKDPTWEMMRVTSTRMIKTDASEGMLAPDAGFLMPDPRSLWVHYEIFGEEVRLWVLGSGEGAREFVGRLEEAVGRVRGVLGK